MNNKNIIIEHFNKIENDLLDFLYYEFDNEGRKYYKDAAHIKRGKPVNIYNLNDFINECFNNNDLCALEELLKDYKNEMFNKWIDDKRKELIKNNNITFDDDDYDNKLKKLEDIHITPFRKAIKSELEAEYKKYVDLINDYIEYYELEL